VHKHAHVGKWKIVWDKKEISNVMHALILLASRSRLGENPSGFFLTKTEKYVRFFDSWINVIWSCRTSDKNQL